MWKNIPLDKYGYTQTQNMKLFIVYPLQPELQERVSVLPYTYIACLVETEVIKLAPAVFHFNKIQVGGPASSDSTTSRGRGFSLLRLLSENRSLSYSVYLKFFLLL